MIVGNIVFGDGPTAKDVRDIARYLYFLERSLEREEREKLGTDLVEHIGMIPQLAPLP